MIDMQPLTPRQKEILDFIARWIGDHGFAPSLEEIGKAFSLTSLATVYKHLENLKDKGCLRRAWGRSRSIELVWQADRCPTCGRCRDEAKVEPQEIAVEA